MHLLRKSQSNDKQLLIMADYFSLKKSNFNNRKNCTFTCLMLFKVFYIYLHSLSNISTLCTMVDCERFSVFRVDH
jgi:hypothetical protein